MTSSNPKGSNWSQLLAALRQLDEDERSGKVQRHRPVIFVKSLPPMASIGSRRAQLATEGMILEARRLALQYDQPD